MKDTNENKEILEEVVEEIVEEAIVEEIEKEVVEEAIVEEIEKEVVEEAIVEEIEKEVVEEAIVDEVVEETSEELISDAIEDNNNETVFDEIKDELKSIKDDTLSEVKHVIDNASKVEEKVAESVKKNSLLNTTNVIVFIVAVLLTVGVYYVLDNNKKAKEEASNQINGNQTQPVISEDDFVKDSMDKLIAQVTEKEKFKEKNIPVANGNIVSLNYEGFLNDVAFEGGKAEDAFLEIGSGSFIPGFEEQLIGHKKGEAFDIKVTFPTEYPSNPELAGKETTFKIKLNNVFEADPKMKYNDEMIKEMAKRYPEVKGLKTVKEFEKHFEEKIRENYKTQNK